MFAQGRYSRVTESCVARWLTNGRDSDIKDEALGYLWDTALCERADEAVVNDAYSRWSVDKQSAVGSGVRYSTPVAAYHIRIWQGIAACLLVAVGVLGGMLAHRHRGSVPMVQVYCAAGETRSFTLPDGTEVMLNGSTSIVYPERFEGKCREVVLLGEGAFKVAKDAERPFVVKSNDVSITALGTEFNLKAYPSQPQALSTLIEGKVKVVYGNDNSEFILHPSEQLAYNRLTGSVSLTHPVIDDVTAWQRGELVFSNATLPEIISELEVRFNTEFIYNPEDLPSDGYTFRFRRGMGLEEVMGIVSDVAGNISVTVDRSYCKIRRL